MPQDNQPVVRRRTIDPIDLRRARLTSRKVDEMFAILIRNRRAFDLARERLTQAVAQDAANHLGLVWFTINEVVNQARGTDMVPRGLLETELLQRMSERTSNSPDEEQTLLLSFLDYAYDDNQHGAALETSDAHVDTALRTCQQLIEEYEAKQASEILSDPVGLPENVEAVLQTKLDAVRAAASLTDIAIDPVFPEDWDNDDRPVLIPYGIPPLDRFTGGGAAGGECVLFMAPFGSCKTTLAVQGAIIHAQAAIGTMGDDVDPVVAFVSTEVTRSQFRYRALSYLARVPHKRLMTMQVSRLSDQTRPGATTETDYERDEFADHKGPFQSEQQRVRQAVKFLNRHILFIPFINEDIAQDGPQMSGIPAIGRLIERHLRQRPRLRIATLWLDHLMALATQVNDIQGGDHHDLRSLLDRAPKQFIDYVAKPFGLPVTLTHQLSGEANARSPTAKIHHTDGGECKSVGSGADFAITSGVPTDDERQLCVWRSTKHRREPPKSYAIVQVDGAFGRLIDRSQRYALDHGERTIIEQRDLATATSPEARRRLHRADHGHGE